MVSTLSRTEIVAIKDFFFNILSLIFILWYLNPLKDFDNCVEGHALKRLFPKGRYCHSDLAFSILSDHAFLESFCSIPFLLATSQFFCQPISSFHNIKLNAKNSQKNTLLACCFSSLFSQSHVVHQVCHLPSELLQRTVLPNILSLHNKDCYTPAVFLVPLPSIISFFSVTTTHHQYRFYN